MGVRPLLKLAREKLVRNGKAVVEAGGQMIADTIIRVVVAHISAKFAGGGNTSSMTAWPAPAAVLALTKLIQQYA